MQREVLLRIARHAASPARAEALQPLPGGGAAPQRGAGLQAKLPGGFIDPPPRHLAASSEVWEVWGNAAAPVSRSLLVS